MIPKFNIVILPRVSFTREEFKLRFQENTIALDGAVMGGPFFDEDSKLINFDHHDNVVREATMSTAMQVYFAIKGGLFDLFNGIKEIKIVINDTDQDTSLSVWLLKNHKLFEGTATVPIMSRFLALNDRWDITGGSFPMNLDDELVRKHTWVFEPYTQLRKSGSLANATNSVLSDNLEAILARITKYIMGEAEEIELDRRYNVLIKDEKFVIYDEIGGNEARYYLWANGMKAFVAHIATRPDGRSVWTIGRKSRFIRFPVQKLYAALNKAELEYCNLKADWNGSDIIGGSNRELGSGLTAEQIYKTILGELAI